MHNSRAVFRQVAGYCSSVRHVQAVAGTVTSRLYSSAGEHKPGLAALFMQPYVQLRTMHVVSAATCCLQGQPWPVCSILSILEVPPRVFLCVCCWRGVLRAVDAGPC
jgi:hypothetical protein